MARQSKMLEEILEQPRALEKTLRAELKPTLRLREQFARKRPKFIILAARGTSDNAAQFGRYLLEMATGIPVSLAAPSIFTLYGAQFNFEDTLVVAISQSGESTDTNLVLERAKAAGVFTIGVTNEPDSSLAKLADHVILVRAGREKSVAATKTYTGQLLAMYLLAFALGGRNLDLDHLRQLPDLAAVALQTQADISARASRYRFMDHTVVVGRGLNYANAFEFALKLMETCYVVAERFSSADFLHGPIAMVSPRFPVFLFAPSGVTWPSISGMVDRLTTLGAESLLVTDKANPSAGKSAHRAIVLNAKIEELYTPIPYIIPAQLFAAYLASEKGLNPDQPRALEKVTKTM